MRKTKIVCTIGPSSDNKDTIMGLCRAGMNVARLNFSHGTYADHKRHMELIKEVREELCEPIAIMLDTKGPEYRIKTFENGRIILSDGDIFTFTAEDVIGDERRVSVSYEGLAGELVAGDTILLNNGLLSFRVEMIEGKDIICRVLCGGELSDRKSMSFPGKVLRQKYLSEQDMADIAFGIENGIDYIACSFVSRKQDILDVRAYLERICAYKVELIAKIENQSGVNNIDEICEASDGIMIARGDMGVEISFEKLPDIQKKLITKCRMLGKRVITATEMLESMIYNPRPTRAEISDVANAVYDGTSAIMLSGETAAGKYPVRAVEIMASIAENAEMGIHYVKRFRTADFYIRNSTDAISHSASGMAIDLDARVIVACSLSGMTARMVSRFRSPITIIGLTADERAWRRLALSWGVIPVLCEMVSSSDELFATAERVAKERFSLEAGDKIVIIGGDTSGVSGNTNLVKVVEI
ncbi:MAG: pyruvate kinase [Clostridia bacterium]|nr:pyruvate kinase [Clostridia bacterium]